jgi:DNA ligase (NAD+)
MGLRTLLETLKAANAAYRNGTPILSDAVYDGMEQDLASMVANATIIDDAVLEARQFLASVGAEIPTDSPWVKVTHRTPMGSLNKAQDDAEFVNWLAAVGPRPLVWSEKLDGISVQIAYTDGTLTLAATRGDGLVGEDITRNVARMKGVVPRIPGFTGHVRGEIVLRRTDFANLAGQYANPRNAASGIAKRLDGTGCEHLTVFAYQIVREGGAQVQRKQDEFRILSRVGFFVPTWGMASDSHTIITTRSTYNRDALDYDIDGLVVEYDDLALMRSLGETNLRPKGATAFKFAHQTGATTLRDIQWQVGNTGRVTPVAIFDAVSLAGASVEKATLHNLSQIQRLTGGLGFGVGDRIEVSRRNDVIPGVEALVSIEGRTAPLPAPLCCPACQTTLVRDGEYLVCNGDECPAQVVGAISRWVKKVGILGLGDATIAALVDAGMLDDPSDLYLLNRVHRLRDVSINGSRLGSSADTIVAEIEVKAEMPLSTLVGSIGIPLCSRSVCQTLVDHGFDTLDKMRGALMADIAAVPGMGEVKAQAFVNGIRAKGTLINALLSNGVRIKSKPVGAMTGLSVCFTGFRDTLLEQAFEQAGGSVKASVVKGLTYLVAKDAHGTSTKLTKARSMGVVVMTPDEFRALL